MKEILSHTLILHSALDNSTVPWRGWHELCELQVLHPQIPPLCSWELFPLLYRARCPHTVTRMKLLPFPLAWLPSAHRRWASDISLGVQPQCSCFSPPPKTEIQGCWGKGLVRKQTYSSSPTCLAKLRPRLAVLLSLILSWLGQPHYKLQASSSFFCMVMQLK